MRSSTLSPKIQRYSMLPATCRRPPCTNIDVKTVTHEKAAGTRPKYSVKASTARPRESSYRNTSTLSEISEIVTYGVVREGMMSRRGIIESLWSAVSSVRSSGVHLPAIRTEDGRPETQDVICRYCGTEIADK